MKKIPTLFGRDPDDRAHVLPEVHPDCQWVIDGEGIATRKFDGTCTLFDGARWWTRREVKPGKTPPAGFVPIDTDEVTGKTVGWEPAEQGSFWAHMQPAVDETGQFFEAGTYELCGPKINGNPEGFSQHLLVPHGVEMVNPTARTFEALRDYLLARTIEGIVWHHPDGRMAKLKRRDFA